MYRNIQKTFKTQLASLSDDYERGVTQKFYKSGSKLNSKVERSVKENVKLFSNRQLLLQRSWKPKFGKVNNVDVFKTNSVDRRWHDFSRVRINKHRKQSGHLEPRTTQAHRNCLKVVVKISVVKNKNAHSKSFIVEQMSPLEFIIKKKKLFTFEC